MGELSVPEGPMGRHSGLPAQAATPAMPAIRPSEQYTGVPHPLLDGLSPPSGGYFGRRLRAAPSS